MSEPESGSDGVPVAARWVVPEINPADTPEARLKDLSEIRENAYAEAHDKGFAAGVAAGQSEIVEQSRRLAGLLECLSRPLESLDEEVETALRDLSFRIARHVVRRELQIDKSQVVVAIREALQALPLSARNVRVRMHPADVELVSASLAQQKIDRSWDMVEDPLLTRGGCRVESDTSRVDAEVESRLARILNHLVEDERVAEREPSRDD